MRPKGALLLAAEAPVELARDGELCFATGEPTLELLAERAARSEDQRLDRARRDLEDFGDLRVGAAFELAHHERGPLVEREVAERAADVLRSRRLVVGRELRDLVFFQRQLVRLPL